MRILAGTSGFAFKEWKGPFYPEDLKDDGMLGYYASRYPQVEINNTFYQLPKEKVILDWASKVPESFLFGIKASQRITHFARLKPEAESPLKYLLATTALLGPRLGPILFQLPPNMKKDFDRLRGFLDLLPTDRRFVVEFRHDSWFEDDVIDEMKTRNIPICVIDQPEWASQTLATADWGYVRLHRFDYNERVLQDWAGRIREQPWKETFVVFKHDLVEGGGSGPPAVEKFLRAIGS